MEGLILYFKQLMEGIGSSYNGLKLTWKHLWAARKRTRPLSIQSDQYFSHHEGIVTLQYPYEAIPIPDNGRYRLHNEIEDCIVCDKCVKVCPVDCIEIDVIKATEDIGLTSDGTPKRLFASKFDIDMAKCCYCGLCTTVCPTECLTMTPTFDYSEYDVRDMNYHFTNLSPDEAQEKQVLYDLKQAEKAAAKLASSPVASPAISVISENASDTAPKPSFKPKFPSPKPTESTLPSVEQDRKNPPSASESDTTENKPKPIFRPKMPVKPVEESVSAVQDTTSKETTTDVPPEGNPAVLPFEPKPKPVSRPKIPNKNTDLNPPIDVEATVHKGPVQIEIPETKSETPSEPLTAPKPIFRPKIPLKKPSIEESSEILPTVNPISSTPEMMATRESRAQADEPNRIPSSSDKDAEDEKVTPISSIEASTGNTINANNPEPTAKPVFKPKMKPIIPPRKSDGDLNDQNPS